MTDRTVVVDEDSGGSGDDDVAHLVLLCLAGLGPEDMQAGQDGTTTTTSLSPMIREMMGFGDLFKQVGRMTETLRRKGTPLNDCVANALDDLANQYLATICEAEQHILLLPSMSNAAHNDDDNLSALLLIRKYIQPFGASLQIVVHWISQFIIAATATTTDTINYRHIIDHLDESRRVQSIGPAQTFFISTFHACLVHVARTIHRFSDPAHSNPLRRFKSSSFSKYQRQEEFFIRDMGPRKRCQGGMVHDMPAEFFPQRFCFTPLVPLTMLSYRDVEKLILIVTAAHFFHNLKLVDDAKALIIPESALIDAVLSPTMPKICVSNVIEEYFAKAQLLLTAHVRATTHSLLVPALKHAFVRLPMNKTSPQQQPQQQQHQHGTRFDLANHAMMWSDDVTQRIRFSGGKSVGQVTCSRNIVAATEFGEVLQITLRNVVVELDGYLAIHLVMPDLDDTNNNNNDGLMIRLDCHKLLVCEDGRDHVRVELLDDVKVELNSLTFILDHDTNSGQRRGQVIFDPPHESTTYFLLNTHTTWCDAFGQTLLMLRGRASHVAVDGNLPCCKIEYISSNRRRQGMPLSPPVLDSFCGMRADEFHHLVQGTFERLCYVRQARHGVDDDAWRCLLGHTQHKNKGMWLTLSTARSLLDAVESFFQVDVIDTQWASFMASTETMEVFNDYRNKLRQFLGKIRVRVGLGGGPASLALNGIIKHIIKVTEGFLNRSENDINWVAEMSILVTRIRGLLSIVKRDLIELDPVFASLVIRINASGFYDE